MNLMIGFVCFNINVITKPLDFIMSVTFWCPSVEWRWRYSHDGKLQWPNWRRYCKQGYVQATAAVAHFTWFMLVCDLITLERQIYFLIQENN